MAKGSTWRPVQNIRVIAIAIIRRGSDLLLMTVRNDDGSIKGYRPLGGGVEFGETAEQALRREIREELGEVLVVKNRLAILENLYIHEGAQGHEIVFVYEGQFERPEIYTKESFTFTDMNVAIDAVWINEAELLRQGLSLYPQGLAAALGLLPPREPY